MASIISAVIVMAIFVAIVVVILLEKMNRAIISLIGALGAFLALTFIDGAGFMTFIEFMFGNALDNYVNFHSLLLILGMSIIVQICYDAGVFQFIAFSLVKTTRGKAMHLLIMLCFLTFVLSSILNNIMTVMIMIPLSITMSRILAIDPRPYILTQAILVNVGGILFPISSIPGILVATAAGIPFIDFFIGIGLFAFVLLGITLALFYVIYKPKLAQPQPEYVEALAEFNAWNFVQDRPLLIKSIVTLLAVLVCFIAIPSDLLSPDIIALSAAVILVVISKVKSDDLVGKLNMELFLYLIGIFVVSGAMEYTGIIELLGNGLSFLGQGDAFAVMIIMLWFSAYLSANIDNIPITKVLIPVVDYMVTGFSPVDTRFAYYSLVFGASLGDNLTPMGDNILVMNIAKSHKRPITVREFFILGFIATNIQLFFVTIYLSFAFKPGLGVMLSIVAGVVFMAAIMLFKVLKRKGLLAKKPRADAGDRFKLDQGKFKRP